MENQNVRPGEEMTNNNTGTAGRETPLEKTGGTVISEHHSPNPTGYAENEEDHRVKGDQTLDDEEPLDSISEG